MFCHCFIVLNQGFGRNFTINKLKKA
jgi:hypothetical protein